MEYEPLETFGGQISTMMDITNGTTFELFLNNLEEHVSYSIRVRAITEAGFGVASDPIIVLTNEAGE